MLSRTLAAKLELLIGTGTVSDAAQAEHDAIGRGGNSNGIVEVTGSIPVGSTNNIKGLVGNG